MNYIYYNVPEPMIGTKLIPLNDMDKSMDETRLKNLQKYKGREEILERQVPLLNCAWNDVLQFVPLDPKKVFELQVEMGFIPEIPHYTFYKIDVSTLDPDKTAVFFKTAPGEQNITVKCLRDVDFASLQDIPEATINYYKSIVDTGDLPFNYQFIPHILYKDALDISGTEIVTI